MTNADLATKPCNAAGCTKPRVINSTGRVQTYCAEHLREQRRKWSQNATGKVVTPRPRKSTEAQQFAGFVAGDKLQRQPIQLYIIDEALDLMIFIDGAITLQCPTDRSKLKPGGFDALLERHLNQGYWILQSKVESHV